MNKILTLTSATVNYIGLTDAALFKLMEARDQSPRIAEYAFSELIDRYGNKLWKACLKFCRYDKTPFETAGDIYRLTLYVAMEKAHLYKEGHSTLGWLSKVAQRTFAEYLRDPNNINLELINDDEFEYNGAGLFNEEWISQASPEQLAKFETAWSGLAEHKREVLRAYLRHYDVSDFGKNCHLKKFEAESLCSAFPDKIKNKYYLPKLRDRALEELYKKCGASE